MTRPDLLRGLVFVVLAAAMSWLYASYRAELTTASGVAHPEMLMSGVAHKPFQYRVLVPWLVKASGQLGLAQAAGVSSPLAAFRAAEAMSVFGLVLAFRSYLTCFQAGPQLASLLSLGLFLALPLCYLAPRHLPVFYPSDTPSILVMVLGLLCLRKRWWAAFYAVFVLGTFNRETTCFLTMAFLAVEADVSSRRFVAGHVAAQFACWAAVKAILAGIYSGNPGGPFQWTLPGTLHYLPRPWIYIETIGALAVCWLPALLHFGRVEDRFARRTALATLPMFCSLLLVGNLDEPRVFGELLPAGMVASMLVVRSFFWEEAGRAGKVR